MYTSNSRQSECWTTARRDNPSPPKTPIPIALEGPLPLGSIALPLEPVTGLNVVLKALIAFPCFVASSSVFGPHVQVIPVITGSAQDLLM